MGAYSQEWLVTDQRGAFAMGTPEGVRIRKYHGFYHGIPGRTETAFLTDLGIQCNEMDLWPHCYTSPTGPIVTPPMDVHVAGQGPFRSYEGTELGPLWRWRLKDGRLSFQVRANRPGGISLIWGWTSPQRKPARLVIRPFFAMRGLHAVGGKEWRWEPRRSGSIVEIRSDLAELDQLAYLRLEGDLRWREDPHWYRNFHYSEELLRGYQSEENLFSAGVLETELPSGQQCSFTLSHDASDLAPLRKGGMTVPVAVVEEDEALPPLFDFVLTKPAGVVAGYPWFGEWGRDTFVALPGLAAAWLNTGADPEQLWDWMTELLDRWGEWIRRTGMLPNLIEKGGHHQWESADATLWWCHSLASLWAFSLVHPLPLERIQLKYQSLLATAIDSIRCGRHLFLREDDDGLLQVTEAHTTWMDARVEGEAVTPRIGKLPEINALWFQARALHSLWSGNDNFPDLEALARRVLAVKEADRSNMVFLHSLPLAPSFVLRDGESLSADLAELSARFWTPVGLRTLAPGTRSYVARCVGHQAQRDRAYHQGPAWGWLAGHFEMARARLSISGRQAEVVPRTITGEKMFPTALKAELPIHGHLPEIFDAELPFTPRGAPAQAWSLACLEEAAARRRGRVDAKLSRWLTQRWRDLGKEKGARRARMVSRRSRGGEMPEETRDT